MKENHPSSISDVSATDPDAPQPVSGQKVSRRAAGNLHQQRSQATQARILLAAHQQFVANGLEGTRMEAIAAAAGVNKSLVYRHFNSRDQLWREVLLRAYQKVRTAEAELCIHEDPVEALDQIVIFTFHYYIENPDFLVIVGIENLNRGSALRELGREQLQVSSLIGVLDRILEAGCRRGFFRSGLDRAEFYAIISSFCWFTVATSHTFGITFDLDVTQPDNLRRRELEIRDAVRRYALRDPSAWPIEKMPPRSIDAPPAAEA